MKNTAISKKKRQIFIHNTESVKPKMQESVKNDKMSLTTPMAWVRTSQQAIMYNPQNLTFWRWAKIKMKSIV